MQILVIILQVGSRDEKIVAALVAACLSCKALDWGCFCWLLLSFFHHTDPDHFLPNVPHAQDHYPAAALSYHWQLCFWHPLHCLCQLSQRANCQRHCQVRWRDQRAPGWFREVRDAPQATWDLSLCSDNPLGPVVKTHLSGWGDRNIAKCSPNHATAGSRDAEWHIMG